MTSSSYVTKNTLSK